MHTTLDPGHKFQLQNRCENGECADKSFQTLEFLRIADDHVESKGLFTQDVIAVLVERAEYQCDKTPYPVPEIEARRQDALTHLKHALTCWNDYTALRLIDGASLLGHVKG